MTTEPPPPDATPRARGFRWPAEWEPHEATLLAWPHDETTFPGGLEHAEAAMARFAAAISRGETVHLCVGDEAQAERAAARLDEAEARDVALHLMPTADVWFRDYGPITLVKDTDGVPRERLAVDFTFNAWGGKYEELLADDTVPVRVQPVLGLPLLSTDFVLEGGSIEGDGEGTLLTTEQCLLHPNRNPDLDREMIAEALAMFLGIEKVLWLGSGIAGDDTDGHVDDLTRFVAPGRVVTAVQADTNDPDHKPLKANLRRLEKMRDARGRKLDIVELPMPAPVRGEAGMRLPASYANFYICNAGVCVPVFDGPGDARALEILGACFPDRDVMAIPCTPLVEGFGALHCVSQQVPAQTPGGA